MNLKLIIAGIILILLAASHYFTYDYAISKERGRMNTVVIEQHEKDSKTALKLEKQNVLLKKAAKVYSDELRKSKDSSNCARVNYPSDRRSRMLKTIRRIQAD